MNSRRFFGWAAVVVFLLPVAGNATWNISVDADGRGTYSSAEHGSAALHAAGLLLRKSIADPAGDRFVVTLLAEAYDSFGERMLHEASLKCKGPPLGRWNITAGRMGLPYGLLTSFSTSRMLLTTWYESLFGFDADNGILFSGVFNDFDYGLALTQGLGAHHPFELPGNGLLTARAGLTLGDAGEYTGGISVVGGRLAGNHGEKMAPGIAGVGIAGTVNAAQLIFRASIDAGKKGDMAYIQGFGYAEYGVNRYGDILCGIKTGKMQHLAAEATFFAGYSFKNIFFTMRGGYSYVYGHQKEHQLTMQVYRLISFVL